MRVRGHIFLSTTPGTVLCSSDSSFCPLKVQLAEAADPGSGSAGGFFLLERSCSFPLSPAGSSGCGVEPSLLIVLDNL